MEFGRQSTQPFLVHPYRRHGTAFERTLRRSNCCRNLSNGALYWGSWGGPTLDVSSASTDIFTTAPTLSDSLVSGGRWWARPPGGESGEWDLVLVQNWGTCLLCTQNGSREKLGWDGGSFLCPCTSCFPSAPAPHPSAECHGLASHSSLLSLCLSLPPELPVLNSSSGSLPPAFLGTLCSGVVPFSQMQSAGPHFLLSPSLLLFCTLRSFHEQVNLQKRIALPMGYCWV